ncbi:MAG: tetratricopeptide repeat protein [Taibaiella sp.]|nr:tetratricopeptide repeat protein [Taibaiella sp.]
MKQRIIERLRPGVIITFLVATAFMSQDAQAQKQGQERVDSLLTELRSSRFIREDTNKVKLLANISFAIHNISPKEGLAYAAKALSLAETLDWNKGRALAHNSFYASFSAMSQYDSAIAHCRKSLRLFQELGNRQSVAINFSNLAECYSGIGQYVKSLEYNFKALKENEAIGNARLIASGNLNIGSTYVQMELFDKSEPYLLRALKQSEQLHDELMMGQALVNLGNSIYCRRERFDEASAYAQRAYAIFSKLGELVYLEATQELIASLYKEEGQLKKSIALNLEAAELSHELGNKYGEAVNYYNVGFLYTQIATGAVEGHKSDMTDVPRSVAVTEGILYLERAAGLAGEIGLSPLLSDCYGKLSIAYEAGGRCEDGLKAVRKHIDLNDSLQLQDFNVKTAELELKREAELKEKQIEINKLERSRHINEQRLLVAGITILFLAMLAIGLGYRRLRSINRSNVALLKEKDVLMKEIHHRVKNNLQVISTLLDLELNRVSDDAAREAMTESATRVRSISLIHQLLYQRDQVSTVATKRFVHELFKQVASVLQSREQTISLNADVVDVELDIDTAVPLGLLLNELLTNSFKHAFLGVQNGSIKVRLQRNGDQYELHYSDSGPGLPAGMDLKKLTSLGMKLVNRLSKQMGGSVTYYHAKNQFNVVFRDNAGRKTVE